MLAQGRLHGLDLAGYQIGASLVCQLETAELAEQTALTEIKQSDLGGPGLWLRAEPEHDEAQALALADLIAEGLAK